MGTNESQCSPAEAAPDALDFMKEIRKKGSDKNREKICYQNGSNPCLLQLSLQTNFGDERCKGNHPQDTRPATLAVTVCVDRTSCLQC